MFNLKSFENLVDTFYSELSLIKEEIASVKLAQDKWALKEIIGHLTDSASNNHQRFVRLQSGDLMNFPAYDAETWIEAGKYINLDWDLIVSTWYGLNRLLLNIIRNIDDKALENVWVVGEGVVTLEMLINEYYKHMQLHIDHFRERMNEIKQFKGL